MKVAICGYPPLALQVQAGLQNSGIEFTFFIRDFVSMRRGGGNQFTNLPPITFFDFRRLVNAGELDDVIIAEDGQNEFTKAVVQTCKFYNIPKVGLICFNPFNSLYLLDANKIYIPYLETNLVDGCNLNCKGCTHFAGLFKTSEVYPLETFRRDVRQLSQMVDVGKFRLLGGEPLLLKNLDEYIKVSREYLPNTYIQVVTNGLLIPAAPKKLFDTLRETKCDVDISAYPPTLKMADKIKETLVANGIVFHLIDSVKDEFLVFMTLRAGHNPEKSRAGCTNDGCRFLRDGRIYKCPVDALSYRFAERFGIKNYPKATGVDLYAPNFAALLPMLDGNVEMCHWCGEAVRKTPWTTSNSPKLEDWLADPAELH